MSGERYEQVGWLHTPTGEVYSMTEWDYTRPETHEPVYVKVPDPATLNRDDPHSRLLPNLERCSTCGIVHVGWTRHRMPAGDR